MTRQRIRPGLKRSAYTDCPCCHGTAVVKTPESMAIEVVRLLILASQRPQIARVTVTVAGEVVDYLNNKKRHELARLEDEGSMVGASRCRRKELGPSTCSSIAATPRAAR